MSAQAVPGARTALLNGIGGGTIAGVVALARYRNPLTAGHAAVGTFTLIAMLDWQWRQSTRVRHHQAVEGTKQQYRALASAASSGRSAPLSLATHAMAAPHLGTAEVPMEARGLHALAAEPAAAPRSSEVPTARRVVELARQLRLDDALALYRQLRAQGAPPRLDQVTALTMAAIRTRTPAAVDWLHQDLRSDGGRPDAFLYTTLLNHYSGRNFDQAWALFQEMRQQQLPLPLRTLNTLLLSDGITSARADTVWATLTAANMVPNMHTYVGRLRAAMASREPAKAWAVWTEMRRSGIAPQAAHYNVLLAGLVRLQDLDRAHAVLQDMLQARVRPTLYTYNALLDAAVRSGNRARAYEMLDAMEEQFGASVAMLQDQHAPDGCSYNIVARLYHESDSAADAEALERLLARARARGVAQAELYHALMALYGRQGRVDAASATVARMADDGCALEPITVNILLDAEARTGPGAFARCLAHLHRLETVLPPSGLSARACAALVRAAATDLPTATADALAAAADSVRHLRHPANASPPATWPASTPPLVAALIDLASDAVRRDLAPAVAGDASAAGDGFAPVVHAWTRLAGAAATTDAAVVEALDDHVHTLARQLGIVADARVEFALANLAEAAGHRACAERCIDRFLDATTTPSRRWRITLTPVSFAVLLQRMAGRPTRRDDAHQLYMAARAHGLTPTISAVDAVALVDLLLQLGATSSPAVHASELRWALTAWQDAYEAVSGARVHVTTEAVWVQGIFKVERAAPSHPTEAAAVRAAVLDQGQRLADRLVLAAAEPDLVEAGRALHRRLGTDDAGRRTRNDTATMYNPVRPPFSEAGPSPAHTRHVALA